MAAPEGRRQVWGERHAAMAEAIRRAEDIGLHACQESSSPLRAAMITVRQPTLRHDTMIRRCDICRTLKPRYRNSGSDLFTSRLCRKSPQRRRFGLGASRSADLPLRAPRAARPRDRATADTAYQSLPMDRRAGARDAPAHCSKVKLIGSSLRSTSSHATASPQSHGSRARTKRRDRRRTQPVRNQSIRICPCDPPSSAVEGTGPAAPGSASRRTRGRTA